MVAARSRIELDLGPPQTRRQPVIWKEPYGQPEFFAIASRCPMNANRLLLYSAPWLAAGNALPSPMNSCSSKQKGPH
jgi:hypothetical protein